MKLTIQILFISSMLLAGDNTAKVKVTGMMCSYSCVSKVNAVINDIDGVKSCSVDFNKGEATVIYDDDKVGSKEIVSVLTEKTNYKVTETANDNRPEKRSKENTI
ncbi:uncharacterized protein METZ01_LOCUS369478 [marine metagenome]|uniref:HMA domain-containing protein n=1 Tax=marine metagenome TaxID=408172 RepID=A0A382T389_9ZZZZ